MNTGVELKHRDMPRVVSVVGDSLLYYCWLLWSWCWCHVAVLLRSLLYMLLKCLPSLWWRWFWRVVVNAMSSLACWMSLPLLSCCKCHIASIMFMVDAPALLLPCHHCCFITAPYCRWVFVSMFLSGWHSAADGEVKPKENISTQHFGEHSVLCGGDVVYQTRHRRHRQCHCLQWVAVESYHCCYSF